MTNSLTFETHTLSVIDRDGMKWLSAPQLGLALGYQDRGSAVNRIYARYRDEFTDTMTWSVNLTDQMDDQDRLTRVFSLRGAWLIALLARTEIAKRFRVWVLNLIEAESALVAGREAVLEAQLRHARETLLLERPRWQRIAHYYNRDMAINTIATLMRLPFDAVAAELMLMEQAGVIAGSPTTDQAKSWAAIHG